MQLVSEHGYKVEEMGKNVQAFENEFAAYTGAQYAVATNSCTSALEIALKAIGIKRGDHVIVPAQTFIATGSCVALTGGSVVFCDTDDNFLISLEDLKKKIGGWRREVMADFFRHDPGYALISYALAPVDLWLARKVGKHDG